MQISVLTAFYLVFLIPELLNLHIEMKSGWMCPTYTILHVFSTDSSITRVYKMEVEIHDDLVDVNMDLWIEKDISSPKYIIIYKDTKLKYLPTHDAEYIPLIYDRFSIKLTI